MDLINKAEVLKVIDDYMDGSFVWGAMRAKIAKQPTVLAVPIEVLQEIRKEVNDELSTCEANAWSDVAKGFFSARCIIDKHIKRIEGSDKE